MKPKVIRVADYNEFVTKVSKCGNRNWVFRGHGHVGWRIESSLARHLRAHQQNIDGSSYDVREGDSIRKFQKSAHQFLSHLPADADKLGWLAIMQHFGAPTRLVDFTYSPYVALYFAVADAGPNIRFGETLEDAELSARYEPYEVHALHIDALRDNTRKIRGKPGSPSGVDYCIGSESKQVHEYVGFFEGNRLNPRQVAQQGIFLVPSKITLDIEKILSDCPSKSKWQPDTAWVTFRFPGGREAYSEMVYSLISANLTAESLFPGLEGVARSIYLRWYQRGIWIP